MTKFVINLLLILSIPLTAAAAPPEPGDDASKHHGSILGRLSQELGLTDDQKAKAKELYQENKLKTKAKREEIKESLILRQKMKLHKLVKSPEVRDLKNDIKEQIAKEKLQDEVKEKKVEEKLKSN